MSSPDKENRQSGQINGIGQNKFNKIVSLFSNPSTTTKKAVEDIMLENNSFRSKMDMWKNKIEKNKPDVLSLEDIKRNNEKRVYGSPENKA